MSQWRKVTLFVVAFGALLVVGGGAGAAAAIWGYGRSLNRSAAHTSALQDIPSSARPSPVGGSAGKAGNILLLGSDSRSPETTVASRSDTIMLLHIDADHRHGYVISIPRDTWVYVPRSSNGRHGDTMAKINAGYAWGGVELAVRTIERFTGVRIDHVVVIDFSGFQRVVDTLGGLDLRVDQTITSIFPPHRTYLAGTRHFTGAQALDYVRQRYQFADGDFTRERHQQEFLAALLEKATSSGTLADPVRLDAFLRAVTKSVTIDKDFDLVSTALELRHLGRSDVTFLTSPSAGTGRRDGQSVVEPDTAKVAAFYHAVASDQVARYLHPTPGTVPDASPASPGGPSSPAALSSPAAGAGRRSPTTRAVRPSPTTSAGRPSPTVATSPTR